jgi:hypothetical protein
MTQIALPGLRQIARRVAVAPVVIAPTPKPPAGRVRVPDHAAIQRTRATIGQVQQLLVLGLRDDAGEAMGDPSLEAARVEAVTS